MKFLPKSLDGSNLMILNTYYNSGSPDISTADDVLDIIYKDMDTGKKYVETIRNPKIEIYIVKPEYRTFKYMRNFNSLDECTKYTMPYKSRFKHIAEILGCNPKEAKYSPYVSQSDMEIEHFYYMQFLKEYGNDLPKKLSLGFSDIESDIINCTGFADPGEAPQNVISYYDDSTKNMYTLVNIQDNIPVVDKDHRKYEYYETLRRKFKEQTTDFVNRVDEFVKECNERFDESYGHIDYNVLIFEDEISLLKTYWDIVYKCDNDYLLFWNAPYDVSNLIERPKVLGYNPNKIIQSKDFVPDREIYWKEDNNATVHKRKHKFGTFTNVTIMDQMVNYAGIRSGRGKLPSVKLNAIAKKELNDEKLDYSEYGNIRMFPYHDFWSFIAYNIKDILLQVGIERKTRDTDSVYTTIYLDCVRPSEVFTSTVVIANSLRYYSLYEQGYVMGSNKNKLYRVPKTEEQKKEEKKDKFAGAFVMNPAHCSSTGFKLLAQLNKYIHDHAIDMDITSEYPTGMLIMNSSNETMVGKVFLVNPENFDIPLYDNMYIIDSDDEAGYKKTVDVSNLMMEGLSENNPTEFGRVYFKLPTFTQLVEEIEDNLDDFI